jgi:hypothetical protein
MEPLGNRIILRSFDGHILDGKIRRLLTGRAARQQKYRRE